MEKIYYNQEGWVCQRYPYDIPVEDETRFIEVDEDLYSKTLSCPTHKSWRVVNNVLVIEDYEETPIEEILQLELQEIKRWLRQNDWIPNKIIREEWTKEDPRWIEYKEQCQIKRTRQDEIENILNGAAN